MMNFFTHSRLISRLSLVAMAFLVWTSKTVSGLDCKTCTRTEWLCRYHCWEGPAGKRALQLPETGFYEDNRRDSGFDNILRAVEDNVADKIFKTYKTEADSKATSSSSQNFRFDYPKTKTFGSSDKCELDSIVRRLPPQWRQELVELIMLVSSSFSE
ncbi:uncharacterized protein [Amphiura filiformis]|uniref:uncharacterized protein isoform X2 n=1 Tax=Amphiura filiformis TaxID=82378 RepID=UPI003B225DAB